MLLPPDTVALEAKGFRVLADLGQTPTSNTTVTVQRKFADSSRDVVQRYVNALVQGSARAKSDRAFAVGVLKKWLKLEDEKLAAAAYDHYAKIIPALPEPRAEQFADAIAQLGKTNEKVRTLDVSKILDASFVRAAR
jgi:ABC-type nitrate/sulfonate/bicarbonate transport system substrate-binding protein